PGPRRRVPRIINPRGRRSALGLAARLGDRELFELVPGLHVGAQPARRRPAARPGLGTVFWIAILRRNLAALELAAARLRTALGTTAAEAQPLDRRKLCLEFAPGRRRLVGDQTKHAVAKRDQIIE